MTVRVLEEARDDLRDAVHYYRHIPPPALGKQLAAGFLACFNEAARMAETMGLSRPEHPDIPLARFILLPRFPYLLFYTVKDADVFVVSVDYATSDYVDRVTRRMGNVP